MITKQRSEEIKIAEGISLTRHSDIEIYSVKTSSPTAIDEWMTTIKYLLKTHPTPYQLIYDFSGISILRVTSMRYCDIGTLGLTLDHNDEMMAILDDRPDLKVGLAVVIDATISSKVSRVVTTSPERYQREFFVQLNSAIDWLLHLH